MLGYLLFIFIIIIYTHHRCLEARKTTPLRKKTIGQLAHLYHTYKLYKQLILNRIVAEIDKIMIKGQAGFRPETSDISQILKLIQHIRNGFEEKK